VSTAERYVTAAYCVIFALVLLYVVIIALKLQRLEREVAELAPQHDETAPDVAELAPRHQETVAGG
jgi:CcmD family protein